MENVEDADSFHKLVAQKPDRTVTIKFVTLDSRVFTHSFEYSQNISDVKATLAEVFNVPEQCIDLICKETVLLDNTALRKLDWGEFCVSELQLQSNDDNYKISAVNAYKDLSVPDILTVKLRRGLGYQDVVVEIHNRCILKPYLGGYINKKTQIEYNHGWTQTGPLPPRMAADMKRHRDSQTVFVRHRSQETGYSRPTQMQNDEVWIPSVSDKLIVAGKYETADERDVRLDKVGKVRIIQRYYRAWRMRVKLKELSAEYKKRIAEELKEQEYGRRADGNRKRRELIGKVFPRTKTDFNMLYSILDRWKKGELKKICAMTTGPSKISEMYRLLENEIQILTSIELHKNTLRADLKAGREVDFFRTISEPIQWHSNYKHALIEMETLEIQRGQAYKDLFYTVSAKGQTMEQRMEMLCKLKEFFKDHRNCEVITEMVQLVDRACLLIARGMHERHLDVLQMRIESLLLKHIKMPECSEGVSYRLERVREKLMHNNLFYCPSCLRLKTGDNYRIDSRTQNIRECISCQFNDRLAEPWTGIAPYRFILRCIRREERRKQAESSIAFIMQDRDIHHIIVKIWHAHSAISEDCDVYNLRLVRWFRDIDWSPWNCVLLTSEEATSHLEIPRPETVYDAEFLYYVLNKHQLARRHFANALHLEAYFMEYGDTDTRWNEIRETIKFVPVSSKMKIFLNCH